MTDIPIIVISSSNVQTGKTTLALNLAAVLWSDGYDILLFAPHNKDIESFMQQREMLNKQSAVCLPMPQIIDSISNIPEKQEKSVIIADIPTVENGQYRKIFSMAHTLISMGNDVEDLSWDFSDSYMEIIWQAKKDIAARGIKYLNWIAMLNNQENSDNEKILILQEKAKKYGYRIAEPLKFRNAYKYWQNGYCTADMAKFRGIFKMSLEDVYARREILKLTDFLWKMNKSAQ